ncbi:DUF3397 domain-containing protein [Solibacillus sp. FSL H8-0538]|uniref:DUF3397 domain-containing protein n=1 Tax=Solibacillus sp. FSL H8-0538 TaxID=2921400 RepID=UPI0030F7346B
MKFVIQVLMTTILFCPIIALLITYVIFRKCKIDHVKAFGLAADITTCVLFLTVPLAINSIWEVSLFIPVILMAVVIAVFFTYIDWKTKKEIEVLQLLKKLWRIYFILLGVLYFVILVGGLTQNIIGYVAPM